MKNRVSVLKDKTLCWLMQLFGILIFLAALLFIIAGISITANKEIANDVGISLIIIFFLIAFLGILLFIRGRKIHGLLSDFQLYASILATNKEKSVEKIASATNQPLDAVMKKTNAMCRRHYFSGHLDYTEKRVVFESDASASTSVIRCPGCGAKVLVEANGSRCAYCGSPMTVETK